MNAILFLIFMFSISNFANASELSDKAASLGVGQWTEISVDATKFNGNGFDIPQTYWADSGEWDPVYKRMIWFGGPGSCCGDHINRFVIYYANEGRWEVTATNVTGSAHGYDHNAYDPNTQIFYFRKHLSQNLIRFDLSQGRPVRISDGPTIPSEYNNAASGFAWFKDLNGVPGRLINVASSGRVGILNGNSWSSISQASSHSWGKWHNFAQYNPVLKEVWFGGGTGGGREHLKIDQNFNVTKFDSTRVPSGVSLEMRESFNSVDPVSGKYIVIDRDRSGYACSDGDIWYEFDSHADRWKNITSQVNMPKLCSSSFHVPISTYGVIMFFKYNGGVPQAFIYKHSPSTPPVEGQVAPDSPKNLEVN